MDLSFVKAIVSRYRSVSYEGWLLTLRQRRLGLFNCLVAYADELNRRNGASVNTTITGLLAGDFDLT